MKRWLLASLFVLPTTSMSAQAVGQYPLNANDESSRIVIHCGGVSSGTSQCDPYLQITATINGVRYEMEGGKARNGLLVLGSYKMKLVSDKHRTPYLTEQTYEIQYPDGVTEKFRVVSQSK